MLDTPTPRDTPSKSGTSFFEVVTVLTPTGVTSGNREVIEVPDPGPDP